MPGLAFVVWSVLAVGVEDAGVWDADWATAGMARQKLSNHAMEAETARAFIGDSDPERFLILLHPNMRRLAWTPGCAALARARKLLSMKERFLRTLYAETQIATRRNAESDKPQKRSFDPTRERMASCKDLPSGRTTRP